MKLYRHHKNKPYAYLGLAKHSETLEDMVIYEARYENAESKKWVRPKKMFFENIEIDGIHKARFTQVPLKIATHTEIASEQVDAIAPLIKSAFGEWDPKWFQSGLNKYKNFYLQLASIDEKNVGFKLGYERDKDEFYSWLGGVVPEFRGLGIAMDLMKSQHEWCQNQGYSKIGTKTQNRFKSMLLLNIQAGFEIIGTDPHDKDGMKILMEKRLNLKFS